VPIPAEAIALELQSLGAHGQPTLGKAFVLMRDAWRAGHRDRELALHVAFLAWYLLIEPPHLTGLDEATTPASALLETFHEAHAFLLPRGTDTDDAEALFVIGLPAHMFAWIFAAPGSDLADADREWTARAVEYRRRYRELRPNGLDAATFAGRGAYGDYFAGHGRVVGGF
jgi:hypothetical protein